MLSLLRSSLILFSVSAAGCSAWADHPAIEKKTEHAATPIYNTNTGRLEQLEADRNGDGKVDTRAFMDGKRLLRIELDRTGDGRIDRWEYYADAPAGASAPQAPDALPQIERAEEANGSDDRVTRREFYAKGAMHRAEEDTDLNGRVDKWEYYEDGRVARLELDLTGAGVANRRMSYRPGGQVDVEVDPEGRGNWRPITAGR